MRVAEITTRIIRVIEVPRSELSEAGLPRAYIGQSGNVGNRLVQHNQGKDFWNRAMVVISLTNSMTQTHALFLEWFAIADRYQGWPTGFYTKPFIPQPKQCS